MHTFRFALPISVLLALAMIFTATPAFADECQDVCPCAPDSTATCEYYTVTFETLVDAYEDYAMDVVIETNEGALYGSTGEEFKIPTSWKVLSIWVVQAYRYEYVVQFGNGMLFAPFSALGCQNVSLSITAQNIPMEGELEVEQLPDPEVYDSAEEVHDSIAGSVITGSTVLNGTNITGTIIVNYGTLNHYEEDPYEESYSAPDVYIDVYVPVTVTSQISTTNIVTSSSSINVSDDDIHIDLDENNRPQPTMNQMHKRRGVIQAQPSVPDFNTRLYTVLATFWMEIDAFMMANQWIFVLLIGMLVGAFFALLLTGRLT